MSHNFFRYKKRFEKNRKKSNSVENKDICTHKLAEDNLKTDPIKNDFTKYTIRRYEDNIEEAKDIVNFLKHSNNHHILTNNVQLEKTISAMLIRRNSDEQILLSDFLIKTAYCLLSLSKSKYIEICSSHPFCSDEFKGGPKTLNFKLHASEILEKSKIDINKNEKYSISLLLGAHMDFAQKISKFPIKKINLEKNEIKVDTYEYIRILQDLIPSIQSIVEESFSIKDFSSNPTNKNIWICGLSDDCELSSDQIGFISKIQNPVFSYSELQNSAKRYPNVLFKDSKEEMIRTQRKVTIYQYSDPCPHPSLRKRSFAINHITKLLNNPYQFYIEGILGVKQHSFHKNHTIGVLIHAVFEECIKNNAAFSSLEHMNKELEKIIKNRNLSKIDEMIVLKKIYLMSKTLWSIIKDADELYSEKEGIQEISHNDIIYLLHGRADLIYRKKVKINNTENCKNDSENTKSIFGVVDFKTGSIPSWINILNGSAPQISVEILMLKFGGFIDEENIEITKSGFVWPRGFLEVKEDDVIKASIDGIRELIETFWVENQPYVHINDAGPYRIISRDFSHEAN